MVEICEEGKLSRPVADGIIEKHRQKWDLMIVKDLAGQQ